MSFCDKLKLSTIKLKEEMNLYEKEKLYLRELLAFLLLCAFIMCAGVTAEAGTNLLPSVKQAKAGTWHQDENGSFLSEVKKKERQLITSLRTIKGKTYYFSKSTGQLSHGWQTIGGRRYYFFRRQVSWSKKKWIGSRYVSSDGAVTKVKQTSRSRLIIFGDCRVASIRDCRIGNAIYIGKVSMGYDWLISTAEPMLESYLSAYPEFTVAFGFGLNDYLYQQEKYIAYYRSFIASHPNANIYLTSVNPVIGVGAYNVSNTTIKPFNDTLKKDFPDTIILTASAIFRRLVTMQQIDSIMTQLPIARFITIL